MNRSHISVLKSQFQSSMDSAHLIKNEKKKRPPPLSIRLNKEERIKLERDANGKALSTYAKQRIFRASSRNKSNIEDAQALARILSALGKTELFANLSALIQAIESGQAQLSTAQEQDIGAACAAVLLIRNDLIKALGLKPE